MDIKFAEFPEGEPTPGLSRDDREKALCIFYDRGKVAACDFVRGRIGGDLKYSEAIVAEIVQFGC